MSPPGWLGFRSSHDHFVNWLSERNVSFAPARFLLQKNVEGTCLQYLKEEIFSHLGAKTKPNQNP